MWQGVFVLAVGIGVLHAGAREGDELWEKARSAAKAGKLGNAEVAYRRALTRSPNDYRLWYELAEVHRREKRWADAACALEQALSHNPQWGEAHVLRADTYLRMGHADRASAALAGVRAYASEAKAKHIERKIERLQSRPRSKRARIQDVVDVKDVEPIPSRTPDIEATFQKAVSLYEERDYEGALQKVRAVIAEQPDHGGAFYYGGLIRRRWGQDRLAKINFRKGLSFPELGYNGHYYLGRIYGEEGEYEKAIAHLRCYIAATEYEEGIGEARKLIEEYAAELGLEHIPEEESDDTRAADTSDFEPMVCAVIPTDLDRFLQPYDTDTAQVGLPAAERARGAIREGKCREAVALMEEWLAGSTADSLAPVFLYDLGICAMRIGAYGRALEYFGRAKERGVGGAAAERTEFLSAAAQLGEGPPVKAIQALQDVLRAVAGSEYESATCELLGDAYVADGDPDRAVAWYRRASSRSDSPEEQTSATYKLGRVLDHLGRERAALKCFRDVLRGARHEQIDTRITESYCRIADHHYAARNYPEALENYTAAYESDSGHIEAAWALYRAARALMRLGRTDEAEVLTEKLRELHPDDYWAGRALPLSNGMARSANP